MANVLDYDVNESEFDLLSRYYVHFRMNNLRKVWPTLIPIAMG